MSTEIPKGIDFPFLSKLSPAARILLITTIFSALALPVTAASTFGVPQETETPAAPTKTSSRPTSTPKPEQLVNATWGTQLQMWNEIQAGVRTDQPIHIQGCLVDPRSADVRRIQATLDNVVLPQLKKAVNNSPQADITVQCTNSSANLRVSPRVPRAQTPDVRSNYRIPGKTFPK